MAISMHSASVPIFVRMLGNIDGWLDKAEAHAAEKKFEPSVYLGTRLAPDMLPFTQQIQIACDAAKFCVARLAGSEGPKFEDNETTLADCGSGSGRRSTTCSRCRRRRSTAATSARSRCRAAPGRS
jgi:hypothetical protein